MVCTLMIPQVMLKAQPITANVVGAKVGKKNKVGTEYRSGYESDATNPDIDGSFTDRLDLFYNVADDIQVRLFFNRLVPANENWKFTSTFIEPSFQLFNRKKNGFDGGVLTGLTLNHAEEGAHQFRLILTGEVPFKSFAFRHNSIIAHQLGTYMENGVRYEARWRITYKVIKNLKIGGEMFNNFLNLSDQVEELQIDRIERTSRS